MKQNLRIIFAGGLLAVGMFGLAKAGQLEDGEAAYFKHDYAEAVRLLRPLANKGNAPAQVRLASIYFWGGHGVPQDPRRRPGGIAKPRTKDTPWRRITLV